MALMISRDSLKLYLNLPLDTDQMALASGTQNNLPINQADKRTRLDLFLDECIDQAVSEIESYCDQPVFPVDKVRYSFSAGSHNLAGSSGAINDGGGSFGPLFGGSMFGLIGGVQTLPYFPVQSIESVSYSQGLGQTPTTLTTDKYQLLQEEGVGYLNYQMGAAYATYTAVLSVGYKVAPPLIQGLAKRLAAWIAKESDFAGVGRGYLGVSSVSRNPGQAGIATTTQMKDPRLEMDRVLGVYRRVTI